MNREQRFYRRRTLLAFWKKADSYAFCTAAEVDDHKKAGVP
jgi:hypothetical protein